MPEQPTPRSARRRRDQILEELAALDLRKVRALTDAVLAAQSARLAALEAEAEALRQELREITDP